MIFINKTFIERERYIGGVVEIMNDNELDRAHPTQPANVLLNIIASIVFLPFFLKMCKY